MTAKLGDSVRAKSPLRLFLLLVVLFSVSMLWLTAQSASGSTSTHSQQLASATSGVALAPNTNSFHWSQGADSPNPHVEGAFATVNGLIYEISGGVDCSSGGGTINSDVDVYDPSTNSFTAVAPIPNERTTIPEAAVINGQIYVFGGTSGCGGAAVHSVDVFSPLTGQWTTLPTASDIPTTMANLSYGCGAAIGSNFYYFINGGILVFDAAATPPTWSVLTSAATPSPGTFCRATTVGPDTFSASRSEIVITGAGGGTQVMIFDPSNGAITVAPEVTSSLAEHAAAEVGGSVIVAGGDYASTYVAQIFVDHQTAQALAPLSDSRFDGGAEAVDGTLYLIGGKSNTSLTPPVLFGHIRAGPALLPTPFQALSNLVRDGADVAIAGTGAALLTFPSHLFNLTFEENYGQILAWWRRRTKRVRSAWSGFVSFFIPEKTAPVASDVVGEESAAPTTKLPETVDGVAVTPEDPRRRLFGAAVVIAVGAFLGVMLNPGPIVSETSLEIFIASALAMIVVTALAALPIFLYGRRRKWTEAVHLNPLPLGLLVAALCVIVSRAVNFQPGYLYGVVCGVIVMRQMNEQEETTIIFTSNALMLAVSIGAWFLWVPVHLAAIKPGSIFLLSILDHFCSAMVVVGLVSTAINLIPVQLLPGRILQQRRRISWAVLFGLALFFIVAVIMYSPVTPGAESAPFVTFIVLFMVFAGGSVLFRYHFVHQWRVANGVTVSGFGNQVRALFAKIGSDPASTTPPSEIPPS